MTILYLTFGESIEYHVQAYLSMLSFKKQATKDDRIVMVTTVPQYYRRARPWAEVVPLDNKTVEEWKGSSHYSFRVKTMALCSQAERHTDDHILFVDTDTVLCGSLESIRRTLDQGNALMYNDEGQPSRMKGPSLRMWHTLRGKTVAGVTLDGTHHMWNSGIIGIPRSLVGVIPQHTLQLLDAMLGAGVKCFNVEQYAMSVAMSEHASLKSADTQVAHYWGNKDQWEKHAYAVIARAYMEQLSVEEEIERLDIAQLKNIPIFVHKSNTGRRLKNLIGKLFADKNQKYI